MRFIVCSLLFITFSCSAVDIVKFDRSRILDDPRMPYKYEILEQALIATIDTYGPYQIIQTAPYRIPDRAILDIQSGKEINIFMANTKIEFEKNSLAIKIPLKRGIMNYRLLTIQEQRQPEFDKINDIQSLQNKLAGLRQGWSTVDVFKTNQLKTFEGSTLDGLFPMLSVGRIDYIPLAVNDIADDILLRKEKFTNLAIEKNLAIYIYSPFYIFVSPQQPRLAKRIEEGLERMIANGMFKKIFYRYFGDKLKAANLSKRNIIFLSNPNLLEDNHLQRKEFWFEYDEEFMK